MDECANDRYRFLGQASIKTADGVAEAGEPVLFPQKISTSQLPSSLGIGRLGNLYDFINAMNLSSTSR